MKFSAAVLTLFAHHSYAMEMLPSNSMWMFGENGVQIFSPDGSTELKSISPDKVCKPAVDYHSGEIRIRCDFNDVVTDGQKYVWASVARGVPKVDVFRIDSGDLVGSFGTCGSPRDLDIQPMREEVWVHCSEYSNQSESHLDVFSTNTPTAQVQSSVKMHDNSNYRSWGKLKVHEALGDVGYSTVSGQKSLFKIDLAERRVMEEIDVSDGNPRFYGLYDLAFSPKNGHMFARSEVCCTCGFEGADTFECGRYGSLNITVEGKTMEGQCGRHCQGGPADTVGVIEIDTNTDTVVGTHKFAGTAPVYAPIASPDGELVILFGLDGGKTVELLETGESGQKSTVKRTLTLDFNTTNNDEYGVYNDFAWVNHDGMNYLVVASGADYQVAIVDMDSPNYDVSYVALKDTPYEERRYSRQTEWAKGTNYVWVGGNRDKEAYVIDVKNKKLVKTFTDIDPRKILSVQNNMAYSNRLGSSQYVAASNGGSGGESNALSIAAIVLSCVALAAVAANFFASAMAAKKTDMGPEEARSLADPSLPSMK